MNATGNDNKRNGKCTLFDRSFLPEAEIEFVLLSDTHYMLDPGTEALEFESRRLQSARIQSALSLLAALNIPFIVHLGDLVQQIFRTLSAHCPCHDRGIRAIRPVRCKMSYGCRKPRHRRQTGPRHAHGLGQRRILKGPPRKVRLLMV